MLESVTVPRYGRRWLTFDVTDAVVEWMNGGVAAASSSFNSHHGSLSNNDVSHEYDLQNGDEFSSDLVHPFPNLGLVVEVEDERESRLDAAEFLALRNCTGDDKGKKIECTHTYHFATRGCFFNVDNFLFFDQTSNLWPSLGFWAT